VEGEGKGICGFTFLFYFLGQSVRPILTLFLFFFFFFFLKLCLKRKEKAGEAEVAGTVAACLGGRGEGKGICGLPFPSSTS